MELESVVLLAKDTACGQVSKKHAIETIRCFLAWNSVPKLTVRETNRATVRIRQSLIANKGISLLPKRILFG